LILKAYVHHNNNFKKKISPKGLHLYYIDLHHFILHYEVFIESKFIYDSANAI
jgi:hypothetical protein